jgi:uncharacterized protein YdeI (YjbR/CyaY-like superfamily)
MDNAITFKDREEWRNWLRQNFDKTSHVWLTLYKKGSGKKEITLEESVEEAMCFGWIDSKLKRYDDNRFILRFSPRKPNSVWSRINKERAERLTKSGRMTKAGLATIEEAKKNGFWDNAYTNKIKEVIPLDLKTALMKDKKAWDNFQARALLC